MIKGSCCCGEVSFELAAKPTMMGTCHCTRCRKLGASVFVFVKSNDFSLTTGADAIATFPPTENYKYARTFCRFCGTALGEIGTQSESFPIAANCLDNTEGLVNKFHEFVAEKPDWYQICDQAPQFLRHPVFRDAP